MSFVRHSCQDPARELKKAKQTRKLSTFPKERSTTRFTPATALLAKTAAASPGLVTETVTSKVASHIQVTHKQLHKPDGTPICLACGGDVHQGRRQPSARQGAAASAPRDDWRFCSHACRIEYQTRTGSIVRQRLLQLEKGVCALCGINAHELFMSIRALPPPRRRAVLHDTPGFKGLSWKSMRRLVSAPTEGQFWQADHIWPCLKVEANVVLITTGRYAPHATKRRLTNCDRDSNWHPTPKAHMTFDRSFKAQKAPKNAKQPQRRLFPRQVQR